MCGKTSKPQPNNGYFRKAKCNSDAYLIHMRDHKMVCTANEKFLFNIYDIKALNTVCPRYQKEKRYSDSDSNSEYDCIGGILDTDLGLIGAT